MRAPELSWLTRRGSDPLKVIASVLPRRSQVRFAIKISNFIWVFIFNIGFHKHHTIIAFFGTCIFSFLNLVMLYFQLFYSSLSFTPPEEIMCNRHAKNPLNIPSEINDFFPQFWAFKIPIFIKNVSERNHGRMRIIYIFVPICIKNVSGKNHS